MVQTYGGVETSHRLHASEKVEDGLGELFLLNRLDLTVERHVLLPAAGPPIPSRARAEEHRDGSAA